MLAYPGAVHGLPGANQGTAEDLSELDAAQHLAQRVGLASAEVGERDVRASGVFAGNAPFGLSVPDQQDFLLCHSVIQCQSEPSRASASAGPQLPR